jgi:hypothetical protein
MRQNFTTVIALSNTAGSFEEAQIRWENMLYRYHTSDKSEQQDMRQRLRLAAQLPVNATLLNSQMSDIVDKTRQEIRSELQALSRDAVELFDERTMDDVQAPESSGYRAWSNNYKIAQERKHFKSMKKYFKVLILHNEFDDMIDDFEDMQFLWETFIYNYYFIHDSDPHIQQQMYDSLRAKADVYSSTHDDDIDLQHADDVLQDAIRPQWQPYHVRALQSSVNSALELRPDEVHRIMTLYPADAEVVQSKKEQLEALKREAQRLQLDPAEWNRLLDNYFYYRRDEKESMRAAVTAAADKSALQDILQAPYHRAPKYHVNVAIKNQMDHMSDSNLNALRTLMGGARVRKRRSSTRRRRRRRCRSR